MHGLSRQRRGDHGPSLLASAALLLTVDLEGGEEAVLSLRRSVVRLFAIVVSFPNWDLSVAES